MPNVLRNTRRYLGAACAGCATASPANTSTSISVWSGKPCRQPCQRCRTSCRAFPKQGARLRRAIIALASVRSRGGLAGIRQPGHGIRLAGVTAAPDLQRAARRWRPLLSQPRPCWRRYAINRSKRGSASSSGAADRIASRQAPRSLGGHWV